MPRRLQRVARRARRIPADRRRARAEAQQRQVFEALADRPVAVRYAAVHDGATLDLALAVRPPRAGVTWHALLVPEAGGEPVSVELVDERGVHRALVEVAGLAPGRWVVRAEAGTGERHDLLHAVEDRRDGAGQCTDGPLDARRERVARLEPGVATPLTVVVERQPAVALVTAVGATEDGVLLTLCGPGTAGADLVAVREDGTELTIGTVDGSVARCRLDVLPTPEGVEAIDRWAAHCRTASGDTALRFDVGDLRRPGAAVKFPPLVETDGLTVVRRRPALTGTGDFGFTVSRRAAVVAA